MENDEVIEEVVADETSEDETDKTPTLEDYQKLQKDLQTAIAQKKHYQEKLKKETEKTNKPNTEGLSKDEAKTYAKLYAKGLTDEEVTLAEKIASLNGTTVDKALEDELLVARIEQRKQKEKSEKAQLPPSRGGIAAPPKAPAEMTRDEHQAWYSEQMSKLS